MKVAVIGGGIIGAAIAALALADGFEITLFERDPDGLPASTGNAGLLALPEITPMARPGVLRQVPGWLVDPLGPLAVRWRDLPRLAPWLVRFLRQARGPAVTRSTAALAHLMASALADHQALAARTGLTGHMRQTGALSVYGSEAALSASLPEWTERRLHGGFTVERLGPAETRDRAPALSGPLAGALFSPDYWTVTSPLAILRHLQGFVAGRQALRHARVSALKPVGDGILVRDSLAETVFDRVVIAAGIWSAPLVRSLGLKVLLEAERGYNTTYPEPPVALPCPVFFPEHGFVATPLADGLRVGGAVELAAPDAAPNFARAAAMRRLMRRFVPDLPEQGGREWMGRRPSTPDSLPVIGAAPGLPRVILAFGHGHLGLTLSAATARHAVALIAGRPADPQLQPFGIERFQ